MDVFDITKYIIKMLQKYDYTCTKVKIMKILYFAKGHYYQENSMPLFEDSFEAWINGPVVRDVYIKLTYTHSLSQIYMNITDNDNFSLPTSIRTFLEKVTYLYGQYDDSTLINASHKEKPWKDARGNLSSIDPSTNILNEDTLKNFYLHLNRSLKLSSTEDVPFEFGSGLK